MVMPGVEGSELSVAEIVAGLHEGGVEQAIDIGLWGTQPFGTFVNLCSYDRNRRRSAELANRLVDYHRRYPNAPITLLGCSGGCGIAVFAAEALPPDVMLERIILLAPALSPRYDLGPSLGHTRRGIVSFYNHDDDFILGWGTQTFGTMDRKFTSSAGKDGFVDDQGNLLRGAIEQVPWTRGWQAFGHFGGHAGWASAEWAKHVLAPYVIAPLTIGRADRAARHGISVRVSSSPDIEDAGDTFNTSMRPSLIDVRPLAAGRDDVTGEDSYRNWTLRFAHDGPPWPSCPAAQTRQ